MSEVTNNVNNAQGAELEALKSHFNNLGKNEGGVKKKTKEEILAKYFTPRNPKEVFRILPRNDKEMYDVAFFHVLEIRTTGGRKSWKKVYCPAHNDPKVPKLDKDGKPILDQNGQPVLVPAPCPVCDKYNSLISKQDSSIKFIKKDAMTPDQLKIKANNDLIFKEATKWQAKKFYILRGIDKQYGISQGVKFWRFKHSFKKDGTMDKLGPVLSLFIEENNVAYYDVNKGCDLVITVVDATLPNGRVYKSISAITPRTPSKLHEDDMVVRQWLSDPITWRDVFKPAAAPNITPYQYLQMVMQGNEPYYDDSDTNNKHWVFPGNPELEAKANTKDRTFNVNDSAFEYASDMVDEDDEVTTTVSDTVKPSTVTKADVGTFTDKAVDLTANLQKELDKDLGSTSSTSSGNSELDDLPF